MWAEAADDREQLHHIRPGTSSGFTETRPTTLGTRSPRAAVGVVAWGRGHG